MNAKLIFWMMIAAGFCLVLFTVSDVLAIIVTLIVIGIFYFILERSEQ